MRAADVAAHCVETRTAGEGTFHSQCDLPPLLASMPRALRPAAARSRAARAYERQWSQAFRG